MSHARATLAAAFLVTAAGCGSDHESAFPGSYHATASVDLSPGGGGDASTVVVTDLLVNITELSDASSHPILEMDVSGGGSIESSLDCLLYASDEGDRGGIANSSVASAFCELTHGEVLDLDDPTGEVRRSGDALTIDVSGSYVGDAGEGGYALAVNGMFVAGSSP